MMPDLPLPKPTTPPNAQAKPQNVGTNPVKPAQNSGQSVPPKTEMKPPAVVTALSSVASNQLPKQSQSLSPQSGPIVASAPKAQTPVSAPITSSTKPGLAQPGDALKSFQNNTPVANNSLDNKNPAVSPPLTEGPSPQVGLSETGGRVVPPPTASVPPLPSPSAPASTTISISPQPQSAQSSTIQSPTVPQPTAAMASPPPTPSAQFGVGQPAPLPPSPARTLPMAPAAPPLTAAPSMGQPNTSQSAPVQPAQPKKSPLRFLPLIIGAVVLLGSLLWVGMNFLSGSSAPEPTPDGPVAGDPSYFENGDPNQQASGQVTTIEYWGLWEPKDVMDSIFQEFQTANPNIVVQYTAQSHRDYRERLQAAIASNTGPDVFRFHASWAPMLIRELAPIPSSVLTLSDFEAAFYPVAKSQLLVNNSLVGVPVMYEGLVLYYNKEIFATAGLDPPRTWVDLRNAATSLTIIEGSQIKRAGVALGNSTNVDHFSDIVALLMLQNGAKLEEPNSAETRDALLFYTNFVTKDRVWNDAMPTSTVAFARGDVAMMIAPSWRAFEVQAINPSLQFETVPAPQLSENRIAWANYWAEGVNAFSEKQEQAWKLLQYLSSSEVQKKLYSAQAQVRSFGEPYARKELADELATQPVVAALLQDAPYATGWYMSSFTHDNGINDQIIRYYGDAITAVVAGGEIQSILSTLSSGVQQVLVQYNLMAPPAQTEI